jgi:hypothetical protein
VASQSVYQINNTSIADVLWVYVDGYQWTDAGTTNDVFSYTFSGAPSAYVVDLSTGLMRLETSAQGQLTVTLKGLNYDPLGAGSVYASTANQWVRYLLESKLGLTVDDASFSYDSGSPGFVTAGYYGTSESDYRTVIDEACKSSDSVLITDRQGVFKMLALCDPSTAVPVREIHGLIDGSRPNVILEMDRISTPTAHWKISISALKRWTVLSDDSIDSRVSAAGFHGRTVQTTEFNTAEHEDPSILQWDPFSTALEISPTLNSFVAFTDPPDFLSQASALASSMMSRQRGRRDIYRIRVLRPLFSFNPGDIVKVHYHRYGLSNGIHGQIIRLLDTPQYVEMDLFTVGGPL